MLPKSFKHSLTIYLNSAYVNECLVNIYVGLIFSYNVPKLRYGSLTLNIKMCAISHVIT